MANYKQIIEKEFEYFRDAYPGQRKLLRKFADKIKLELSLIKDVQEIMFLIA